MRRTLPTDAEVREILSRRRTRPAPRPAPKAARALQGLIKELDGKFGRGAAALEPRWREIVGDRLARVTRPQKLTKGRGGAGAVDKLRIAQGPVKPPADIAAPPKRRPAVRPLAASEEAELKAALDSAPDGLKGSLERLGRAVLGDPDKGRDRSGR